MLFAFITGLIVSLYGWVGMKLDPHDPGLGGIFALGIIILILTGVSFLVSVGMTILL